MGREFLDDSKKTLFIFNRIDAMNCVYIEEIDFKQAVETVWTTEQEASESESGKASE